MTRGGPSPFRRGWVGGTLLALILVLLILPTSLATGSTATASLAPHSLQWAQIYPTSSPSIRNNMAMTYDAADGYLLAFGGSGPSGGLHNETWEFHAGNWIRLHLSKGPAPSFSPAMVYDPAIHKVILFGGDRCIQTINSRFCHRVSDTWAYSGGTWTRLTPRQSPPPPGLDVMAYDPQSRSVILYDVAVSNFVISNETWTYQNGTWTQLRLASSPALSYATGAYDPTLGHVLLLGLPANQSTSFAEWELVNGSWAPLKTSNLPFRNGIQPRISSVRSLTYDPRCGCMLLAMRGGLAQAWKLHNSTWHFIGYLPIGYWVVGYDAADQYAVFFGGPAPSHHGSAGNETWTLT